MDALKNMKTMVGLHTLGSSLTAIVAVFAAVVGLLVGLFIPSPLNGEGAASSESNSSKPWVRPTEIFGEIPTEGTTALTSAQAAALPGTEWISPVKGSGVSLSFFVGDQGGYVIMGTGCNTFNGPYSIENSVLTIGEMISTKVGCTPAGRAQERALAEFTDEKLTMLTDESGGVLWLSDGTRAIELHRVMVVPFNES